MTLQVNVEASHYWSHLCCHIFNSSRNFKKMILNSPSLPFLDRPLCWIISGLDLDGLKVKRQNISPPASYLEESHSRDMLLCVQVCGHRSVLAEGFHCLSVGGSYILVGLVHPDSALPFTAEQIIRKCVHIAGMGGGMTSRFECRITKNCSVSQSGEISCHILVSHFLELCSSSTTEALSLILNASFPSTALWNLHWIMAVVCHITTSISFSCPFWSLRCSQLQLLSPPSSYRFLIQYGGEVPLLEVGQPAVQANWTLWSHWGSPHTKVSPRVVAALNHIHMLGNGRALLEASKAKEHLTKESSSVEKYYFYDYSKSPVEVLLLWLLKVYELACILMPLRWYFDLKFPRDYVSFQKIN